MGLLATLGSLLPGVGGLIGGALGGFFDDQNKATDQNEANSAQAQANRDFQERMSSTSWQRGVADMQAAGLNPMLAYSQGGASSPAGSLAAPMLSRYSGSMDNSGPQVQNTVSETYKNYSQAQLNQDNADLSTELRQQAVHTSNKIREETENIKTDNGRILAATRELVTQAELNIKLGATAEQNAKMIIQTTSNLVKDGTLKQADIDAIMSLNNAGKVAGQAKPIFDIARAILGPRH